MAVGFPANHNEEGFLIGVSTNLSPRPGFWKALQCLKPQPSPYLDIIGFLNQIPARLTHGVAEMSILQQHANYFNPFGRRGCEKSIHPGSNNVHLDPDWVGHNR